MEAVNQTIAHSAPGNTAWATVWFDIEACSGCWSSSITDNVNYLAAAVAYAEIRKLKVASTPPKASGCRLWVPMVLETAACPSDVDWAPDFPF